MLQGHLLLHVKPGFYTDFDLFLLWWVNIASLDDVTGAGGEREREREKKHLRGKGYLQPCWKLLKSTSSNAMPILRVIMEIVVTNFS